MCTPAMARPAHYRKPGLWQTALRRLHANGYSDREIAEILWDLDDGAIQALERTRWNQHTIRKHSRPGEGDTTFTRRHVCYLRQQMGLPANPPRPQNDRGESLAAIRAHRKRDYQRHALWGHLLPSIELKPRECDILSLIRDNETMTKGQLAAAFRKQGHRARGKHLLHSGPWYYLRQLRTDNLIEPDAGTPKAFRLTAHAKLAPRRRLETGVERKARQSEAMERLAERIASNSAGYNSEEDE